MNNQFSFVDSFSPPGEKEPTKNVKYHAAAGKAVFESAIAYIH
jgi:hypothetical protein